MLISEMRTLNPEDDIGLHVTNSMSEMSEGMTSKVFCQRYNENNVISEISLIHTEPKMRIYVG